ncbi:ribosomal protein S6 kinase-like 1 isoform X1 [Patagioenas fasciata]|uniref:ribosomal protein S6 kinase-like 1 isoform X1 n=1 Tax=Patagioenas fasciata TaxID=372321 RepID=UPI003A9A4560
MSRPEAEPCSRTLAQARVYLGQLRSRVSPAGPEGGGRRDYLVEAARQLRLALERDVSEDYEEAFNHYQNGVDVLLRGVQVDPNKERREAVKRKITQYLRRAEEIFNCHLQRAAGGGNPTATGYSSLRFRPIRTLSSAVENLRRCKVVGVIDKSLPKSHVETRERQTIIPHGVPFMVKLLCYYVSEDSIFLHLEHVQGEMLWSHLRSKYCVQQGSADSTTTQAQDRGIEDDMGISQGSSQLSIFSARTGSVTHQVLGSTDALPPSEQSPNPTDPGLESHCRLRLAPAVGTKAAPGGQDLSMTQAKSGVVDHVPAAPAKGPGHLINQDLVIYPWDALTSGMGYVSERAAFHPDPGPCAGERLPQTPGPVTKTVRRSQPGAGDLLSQQVSEVPWARPLLTSSGQRQLHAGVAPSSSGKPCGPDPAVREQPCSGQCPSLAAQGHGWRAWAVKEEQVQLWAAEILLALEGLHQQGVLCRDLNPRNLLLDAAGHIRLTFFGQWTEVEPQCCSQAREELYSAPEVGGIAEPTEAADWWSFGSLLYELLTGVVRARAALQGGGEEEMVAHELFGMHGCKAALPSTHQHPLPPAAAVPKPPFRDSPSHPAASARGSQPGCNITAHQAPTIQPEAAFGLWRRWHSKTEVPLLLQQHAMEQAGGLGWLSFPRELGQSRCPCHLCLQVALAALLVGDLPAGTALGWGTHEVLQPYMFVYSCLCVLVSLKEAAAVWARLSSLPLVLPGGKGSPGAHTW